MSGDSELISVPTDDQVEIDLILSTVDNTTFEITDWNIVIKECRSLAAHWEQLSGYIGLSCDLIDSIKGNHPINNSGCWNEALKQWIKQNYDTEKFGKPSWQTLLKALSLVDKQLFKKLATDHQGSENNKGSVAEGTETRKDKCASSSNLKGVVDKPGYTFPLLDLKKMDRDEKERLHQKLYAESENMEYKFQELFKATRISLVERMITMGELLKHLDCLGSVKPLYKGSMLPVFGRRLPRLRKTENVDNAMSVISSYCSFFNYRIVECIINNLGTERDKTNLKIYKEEFSVYAQRHIFKCPSEVGEIDEDSHAILFVTLDTTYDSYTVSHLYAFVNNLQRVLKIPPMSLRLCRIGPGSLKLIFQLPHSIQRTTFPLSSDQEAALADLGVTLLSCGSYLFSGQEIEEDFDSDSDSDCIDSERTVPSMDSRDAELVPMAAGLAAGKPNDTHSFPDSALGRSSVISGTTAGVTQDTIPDRDLEDFTVEMRDNKEESDPKSLKLHSASRNGDLQEVIRLVEEEYFNPIQADKDGWNAIHFVAACGHLDILRYFIEDRGCNAVCSDGEGWTPLHYAARFEHLHIVHYLIEKQVEPFTRNKHGHTALHQACAGGSIDVIHYLAKEMSKYLPLEDVIHDRDYDGFIPLHWATLFGRLDAIIFLITKLNCDPNTTDDKNRTFIHSCAQEGHLDVVKYFIEQQHCDPSCLTVNKVTPLHMAATKGHLKIVKYLTLERHCDPQWTSKNNNTPLHLAAHSGHLHVVKFLIETLHCPSDIRGQRNMTPLEQACSQGHHQVVKYLESISSA